MVVELHIAHSSDLLAQGRTTANWTLQQELSPIECAAPPGGKQKRGDNGSPQRNQTPNLDTHKSPFQLTQPSPQQKVPQQSTTHTKEPSSSAEDSDFDPAEATDVDVELEANDDILPHKWEEENVPKSKKIPKKRGSRN
jgi:hypothetical protein